MRIRQSLFASTLVLLSLSVAAFGGADIAEVEAMLKKNRYDEAIAYLDALPSERDAEGEVSYQLAAAYLGKGDFDQAEDWMDRAVKKDGGNAAFYNYRAGVYFRQTQDAGIFGQMRLAGKLRRDLEKAVDLDPGNVDYRMDLLEYYTGAPGIAGGSKKKAMEQAEAIAKLDSVQGYIARGRVYLAEDKTQAAEAQYLEGLAQLPDNYDLNIRLVLSYGQREAYAKAYEAIGRWKENAPEDTRADYQLGRLAAISGKYLSDGETGLRRYLAIEEVPENGPELHWAYYRLGLVLRHLGQTDAATAAFEKARQMGAEDKQLLATLDELD